MKPKSISREATHQSGKMADIKNKKPKKRLMVQIEVENSNSETLELNVSKGKKMRGVYAKPTHE